MADIFNIYFSEIGQKMASDIENLNCTYEFSCTSLIPQTKSTFFLKPITNQEVLTHSQALYPANSAEPDCIPSKFVAIGAQIIATVLVDLYNNCIIKEIYPNLLKIDQIVPIYKHVGKDICCNYRSMSILSPRSKIFEKCLHDRLY